MKKCCISVVLVWALVVCLLLPLRNKAYADPFTASQIGSVAYAMMQSWGISFTAGSATSSGMNDFMTNQVQDYVNSQGGSIADIFVGRIAVDAAGKLVVGQQMYNSVIGFVDWLKDKFNLGSDTTTLQDGIYNDTTLPKTGETGEILGIGYECQANQYIEPTTSYVGGYRYMRIYNNGAMIRQVGISWNAFFFTGGYSFVVEKDEHGNNYLVCYLQTIGWTGGPYAPNRQQLVQLPASLPNSLKWDGSDYVEPTVLNPDKEWTGTIGGYSTPDTNLDQLLGGIDQAVADNNLVVDGEVIDVPVPPTPVPEPVAPDTPLQDVPWEGLNDLINTNTESLTNSVDHAADDITAAVDNTTEAVQSLENTITETLQPQDIDEKKFDLKLLFPFCIPFDIHNLLQKFQAEPVAPHVQLPFVIQSIGFSYTFDLDFSAFDSVAAAMRTVEFIVFAIGLAWATSKVIKW